MKIEKNGLGYTVHVGKETSEMIPTIRWKDKNGNDKSFTGQGLKIIRRIYFIFYTDNTHFISAAKTRQREIEAYDEFNYVYLYQITDLWLLKEYMDKCIEEINNKCYKHTTEVSFFTHSATDGVAGTVPTSKYSLYDRTGNDDDKFQMTLEGWEQINFNFDPYKSIVNFYGCRASTFAENFIDIQDCLYASSNGAQSSNSEDFFEYDPSWYNFDGESIYMVSPSGENMEVVPMEVIKRGRDKWHRTIDTKDIITNITVDKDGNILGLSKSKKGVIKIDKSDIKYY